MKRHALPAGEKCEFEALASHAMGRSKLGQNRFGCRYIFIIFLSWVTDNSIAVWFENSQPTTIIRSASMHSAFSIKKSARELNSIILLFILKYTVKPSAIWRHLILQTCRNVLTIRCQKAGLPTYSLEFRAYHPGTKILRYLLLADYNTRVSQYIQIHRTNILVHVVEPPVQSSSHSKTAREQLRCQMTLKKSCSSLDSFPRASRPRSLVLSDSSTQVTNYTSVSVDQKRAHWSAWKILWEGDCGVMDARVSKMQERG